MQHSPGPWKFDNDWRRIPTINDGNGIRIASVEKDFVSGGWVKELPQREANARLIGAAPDMLAELKALHEKTGWRSTADLIAKIEGR